MFKILIFWVKLPENKKYWKNSYLSLSSAASLRFLHNESFLLSAVNELVFVLTINWKKVMLAINNLLFRLKKNWVSSNIEDIQSLSRELGPHQIEPSVTSKNLMKLRELFTQKTKGIHSTKFNLSGRLFYLENLEKFSWLTKSLDH